MASGIAALRAARIAAFSPGFFAGSTASAGAPSQAPTAASTAFSRSWCSLQPATSAATFCSSRTFQLMNSSMSGWSRSQITILAARRVVPPDLIAPAARSPIFRKDIRPEDLPPPPNASFAARSEEKFVPVPEPYLKSRASRFHRSMMPPSLTRSSRTDWMKQACGCGCS